VWETGAPTAKREGSRYEERVVRVALFCHSLLSDWNHSDAHFLRGIVTELGARGHEVATYEPRRAWSVENLVLDHGPSALEQVRTVYPTLRPHRYELEELDLDASLDGVDLVLVHSWNEPDLVRKVGQWRRYLGARARVLFYDTHHAHHRAVTEPDLSAYDGVLACGTLVHAAWVRRGWAGRAFVWHEAADVRVFRPRPAAPEQGDLVWIGDWGDDERARELAELLVEPARDLGLRARVHGVRYPAGALALLERCGIQHGGWVADFAVPDVLAGFRVTVHVPRRSHVEALAMPTIRIFEALACGIPIVSAPWPDVDDLFTAGRDYLVARDGREMRKHLSALVNDGAARAELARRGRTTILARHTCRHRVDELLAISRSLGIGERGTVPPVAAAGVPCP
jgi:spore maturation protein CgeB